MEQMEINSPEDIGRLIETRTNYLRNMTQKMIDTEMGLIELDLSLGCLEENHLRKAHGDTEDFKKEMWNKAREISQKNHTTPLDEYKKLINFT